MGVFDFDKNSGASVEVDKGTSSIEGQMNALLPKMLVKFGLEVDDPKVKFNSGEVSIYGEAANQATKEKIVLALGNIKGVSRVNDEMTIRGSVEAAEKEAAAIAAESRFYTVKRGDSLSKIAKSMYGDAMKYPVIFEANKPMLKDPNLIYPGQMLRIPEL
jgi:nucleoid-associated protein YgaU